MPDLVDTKRAPDTEHATTSPNAAPEPAAPPQKRPPPFTLNPLAPYRGLVRRYFIIMRHVLGLLLGGLIAYVRGLPAQRRRGLRTPFSRLAAFFARPFVSRELRRLSFPQQLRRRLEMLGPTYVKLGQIMAIREDILPADITEELKNLLDHLPEIPFEQVQAIIERSLEQPIDVLFQHLEEQPLASASIAQAHRATTREGDAVVIKVIKPGIRETIVSDLKLLEIVGVFLQWIIPRYQPRQIIAEFSAYTLREVDYTYEADNAEIFQANFSDQPGVVFPAIYRHLSSRDVLTMEFLQGFKPSAPQARALDDASRERVIDLGAAAIIQMLFEDGFFHADLHAGNLLILPGAPLRIGFIDLGMVGRFDERIRRQLLYYFRALVDGDVDNATRHLTAMARVMEKGDPQGFHRAAADLTRRYVMRASQGSFSLAQLILESLNLGGRYRVFFPVEMTLMIKALVTFEGVGATLNPHLNVPEASRKHVIRIFQERFHPNAISEALLRNAPEMLDLVLRLPQLLSAGYKAAEDTLADRRPSNPLAGLRSAIMAGACVVGGVLTVIQQGPVLLGVGLFAAGTLLFVFGK